MTTNSPRSSALRQLWLAMGTAAVLAAPVSAQRSALYQQVGWTGGVEGSLAARSSVAYRTLNAIDLARLEMLDALRNADLSAPARDARVSAFHEGDLFARPPRLPVTVTAGGQPFAQLVPEAAAMLNWAHAFRRQVYDVLAAPGREAERQARITEMLGYYRSRPALAISARPKDVGLLNAQFGATAFRSSHPRVNGQLWAMHWMELALGEALLAPEASGEALAKATARFRQMLNESPAGAPFLMPVSTAVAPTLASGHPDVAAILDNLHLLQDYMADIMVAPDIPRSAHRRELMRALQFFRDDTTAAASYASWAAAPATMGARNMGGVAVGFPQIPDTPTVARGLSLAPSPARAMGGMGMNHPGMQASRADTAAMRAVLDRMLSDPVIRERVATDPALQKMLAQPGMSPTSMANMGGMDHGNMNMPAPPNPPARGMAGMQHGNMPMGTGAAPAAMSEEERRLREDFLLLLLSDPSVEARIHADPRLHRLWSDPDVQRRLQELRAARTPRRNP